MKLNCSENFRRNWNVHLVFLERSWWVGFNGIYLVRFGFKMWEILILKWFLLLKISMTMIIRTHLYKSDIWFFFVITTITPWSSTMTITNGCLINNYALEWPFFNNYVLEWWKFGQFLFLVIFLAMIRKLQGSFSCRCDCAPCDLYWMFFLSKFFPPLLEVLWDFLFCISFALKQYECAFFVFNPHYLFHFFVFVSLLLMTIWNCLIPIITFIECRFASKKCTFTGKTFYVFVLVYIMPFKYFCKVCIVFLFLYASICAHSLQDYFEGKKNEKV